MRIRTRLSPGRSGVLLGILVGGVPPGSPNPDPISAQKIPGGTPHIKGVEMLVGNFELNP